MLKKDNIEITRKKLQLIVPQAVKSSNISSVKYEPETKTLEVSFIRGRKYWYGPVTELEYQALLAAESTGKHLNEHFRDNPNKVCREVL